MKQGNNLFSHLLSILALPFMATVVIPSLIHSFIKTNWISFFHVLNESLIDFIGGLLFGIGAVLFGATVFLFAKVGKGTLAPWAPPEKFVVVGPYKHVRNPMLCGVNLMLMGIALFLKNENIILWQVLFLVINTIYFIKSEEPDLVKRFGADYELYKKNVGRWIPRLRGWEME